jgi:hypothetical protein
MKVKKIIIGFIVALIALLVVIFISWKYIDYFRFRPILQNAKYPHAIGWNTKYMAGTVDDSSYMTACFNTHDSKDSVLDYYQSYFKSKGWLVNKNDISPFDNSHTGKFSLELQTPDNKIHGSLNVGDIQESCRFILGIW